MKTIKIFIALLVLTAGAAKAQFTKAELQVSGLTCALCAKATQKSLKTLPFIADIKPDLMRNLFVLNFKSGEAVNFDQISKKVQDAGFFVNSLKVTVNFNNTKVDGGHFSYGGANFQLMNESQKQLSGPVEVAIVDKGFAPKSVSKKYLDQAADAPGKGRRVYHVAI